MLSPNSSLAVPSAHGHSAAGQSATGGILEVRVHEAKGLSGAEHGRAYVVVEFDQVNRVCTCVCGQCSDAMTC